MLFVHLRGRKGRTTAVVVTKCVVAFHTFAYYSFLTDSLSSTGDDNLVYRGWEWVLGRDFGRNPNGCYGAYENPKNGIAVF